MQDMLALEISQAVHEIDRLNLSFLKSNFMKEGEYSETDFDEASTNLKRFFALTLHHEGPLAITSRAVDDLWHTFILFTPQYREFCERAFGGYVDHQTHGPSTPVSPTAFTNFVEAYEELYGPLE